MTNCILNLLRGIGSFLVGSLRMILFFGCLLFAIGQIISLLILLNVDPNDVLELPHAKLESSAYVETLVLLALALLGCYGAFYKHQLSLKVFSMLTALGVIIMVVMMLYAMAPEDWKKENDKFAERMRDLEPEYTWTPYRLIMANPTKADRAWDKLQKVFCCGVNGPDDWNKHRPVHISSDLYPSSCCLPSSGKFCKKPDLFETGCMARVQEIEAHSIAFACLYLVLQFALCIIACVVGNFNLDYHQVSHSAQSGNKMNPQLSSDGQAHISMNWPSRIHHEMLPSK